MYESPIELIATEVSSQLDMEMSRMVYKAIQGIGVNVDKFELEKALRYDRQQYQKGYEDGVRDIIELLKKRSTYDFYAHGVSYSNEFLDSLMRDAIRGRLKGEC
jgi:hypothetical protein